MLGRTYVAVNKETSQLEEFDRAHIAEHMIGQEKNVEIGHLVMDCAVDSEHLRQYLSKQDSARTIRVWDLTKICLPKLLGRRVILRWLKSSKTLAEIKTKFAKPEKKTIIQSIIPFLPLLGIITCLIAVVNFLNTSSANRLALTPTFSIPLQGSIVACLGLIFLILGCISFCNTYKKRVTQVLSELEEYIKGEKEIDFRESDIPCSILAFRKYDVNIFINASDYPQFYKMLLISYLSYQTVKRKSSKFINKSNVIYSINDVESLFYRVDTKPDLRLTLQPLTYDEKLAYLSEWEAKSRKIISDAQRIVLRHLGVDVIDCLYEIKDLDELSKRYPFAVRLREQLELLVKKTGESKELVVSLLYMLCFITNVTGTFMNYESLANLICNDDEICAGLKIGLNLPRDKGEAKKLIARLFKYFTNIVAKETADGVSVYRFREHITALLFICEHEIVEERLFDIAKLCILKIKTRSNSDMSGLYLKLSDICIFAAKVCDFLYQNERFDIDIYRTLLAEVEKHNCIDYHYVIFDIINNHISRSIETADILASATDIFHSSFLSMVHSPFEEALMQHIRFVEYCATPKKASTRGTLLSPPIYMDTFILGESISNSYYGNLMTIYDDSIEIAPLKFIEMLYKLYNISLKNSNIIDDSFFFINKALIDTDLDQVLSELNGLCKNRYTDSQIKGSAFAEFMHVIQAIFSGENALDEVESNWRSIYSFLASLCYYANNSVLDEEFVRFVNLIVDKNELGVVTRCELSAEFIWYQNYQRKRLEKFLSNNADTLIDIMKRRISEGRFTISLAYKSICNILNTSRYISEHNIAEIFIGLVLEKFPSLSMTFKRDVEILRSVTFDNAEIVDCLERMSRYDPNIVAWILSSYHNHNRSKAAELVLQYFQVLQKADLTCAKRVMIDYLGQTDAEPSDCNAEILEYLLARIDKIKLKADLKEFQNMLGKWRTYIGIGKYKEAYVASISQLFKLREIKLKTDAIESGEEETFDEQLAALDLERELEISSFIETEDRREYYSTHSLRRKQDE